MNIENKIKKFLYETVEPGQGPTKTFKGFDNIFINIKTKKEYDFILKWLYEHNFFWDAYGHIKDVTSPWDKMKEDLVIRIHNIRKGRGNINYFNMNGYSGSYNITNKSDNVFTLDEFLETAEYDERINIIKGKK